MGVITFEDEELKRFLKEGTVERKIGTKKITVGSIVSVVRKNGYRTVAKARVINIGEGKAIFEIVTGSVKKNIFTEPVLQASRTNYLDWNNLIPILKKAYQMKINVLIIGPKGSGKTTLIQYLAEELGKELYTVNFSLRTKESNLIGTISLDGNSTKFNYGILPLSMKAGGILYLDEVNAAEPDVLIRLDEALDDRRQLVLKESEKVEVIQAHPDWWVVATINPLSHTGTKELPQQLLSRFPIRIWLDYPPVETIINIVQNNIGGIENQHLEIIKKAVFLMLRLYEAHKMDEIYYSPSLREVIAFAKLIRDGIDFKDALKIVFINCYYQWGSIAVNKVLQFTESIFGKIEGDEK